MNLRNDVSIPMEETRSPSTIRNKDRLPVTFSNYLKILITRFVGEMCWLVFGPISAWIMDFLLFNGEICKHGFSNLHSHLGLQSHSFQKYTIFIFNTVPVATGYKS